MCNRSIHKWTYLMYLSSLPNVERISSVALCSTLRLWWDSFPVLSYKLCWPKRWLYLIDCQRGTAAAKRWSKTGHLRSHTLWCSVYPASERTEQALSGEVNTPTSTSIGLQSSFSWSIPSLSNTSHPILLPVQGYPCDDRWRSRSRTARPWHCLTRRRLLCD